VRQKSILSRVSCCLSVHLKTKQTPRTGTYKNREYYSNTNNIHDGGRCDKKEQGESRAIV